MTDNYIVTSRLAVEASSYEEASRLATEALQRNDQSEIDRLALPANDLYDALSFYADPDSYFAVAIIPDRPSGSFADDVGCVIGPHGDHDHRHGRTARRALGNEWWGTEPCEDMKAQIESEQRA